MHINLTRNSDIYQQALFDDPSGWVPFHEDDRFEQRYQIDTTSASPRIFAETRALVQAPAPRVLALLQGPWNWYGGRYEDRENLPDGKVRYQLWPAGIGIHVQETMSPPEPLPDGGTRLRVDLEKDATGVAYLEVHPQPDGSSEVIGRFAGVEEHTLFCPERFTKNHLLVERGAFIPLDHGGFAGLARAAEDPGLATLGLQYYPGFEGASLLNCKVYSDAPTAATAPK